jgi:hypothetical protein
MCINGTASIVGQSIAVSLVTGTPQIRRVVSFAISCFQGRENGTPPGLKTRPSSADGRVSFFLCARHGAQRRDWDLATDTEGDSESGSDFEE